MNDSFKDLLSKKSRTKALAAAKLAHPRAPVYLALQATIEDIKQVSRMPHAQIYEKRVSTKSSVARLSFQVPYVHAVQAS